MMLPICDGDSRAQNHAAIAVRPAWRANPFCEEAAILSSDLRRGREAFSVI